MLEALPAAADVEPLAYALTADAADEVRALLVLHRAGDAGTAERLRLFFERATPRPRDQRMTPLDPRLPALLARLGANEYVEAQLMEDAGVGDVYAEVERDAMNAALSLMRLIEMDAPGIILQSEIARLGESLAVLRIPPEPTPHPGPEDCSRMTLDLMDGIVANARFDLSIEAHAETLRVLDEIEGTARLDALIAMHRRGAVLVDEATIAWDDGDTRDCFFLKRASAMRWGPEVARLADALLGIADALGSTSSTTRAAVTARLDSESPPELRGDDYVAATERTLQVLAARARDAATEQLVLVTDVRRPTRARMSREEPAWSTEE